MFANRGLICAPIPANGYVWLMAVIDKVRTRQKLMLLTAVLVLLPTHRALALDMDFFDDSFTAVQSFFFGDSASSVDHPAANPVSSTPLADDYPVPQAAPRGGSE